MGMLAYDVTYRLVGERGFARKAVVVVDDRLGDIYAAVRKLLADSHLVTVDKIVDFNPVMLRSGSVITVRG